MNRFPLSIVSISVAMLLASCSSTPEPKEPPLEGSIILGSGPCVGACPNYKMTVSADDRYVIDARENTTNPGLQRGALPVNSFRRAVEALEQYKFDTFANEYLPGEPTCPEHISDLPKVEVARIDRAYRKAITVDLGCIGYPEQDRFDRLYERLRLALRIRELVAVGEVPRPPRPDE